MFLKNVFKLFFIYINNYILHQDPLRVILSKEIIHQCFAQWKEYGKEKMGYNFLIPKITILELEIFTEYVF